MSLLGKLLAAPVRVLNVPLRTIEKIVDLDGGPPTPKEDRIMSAPLESLAEAIEEAVDGEE